MPIIRMGGKTQNVSEKLAAALVKMGKAELVADEQVVDATPTNEPETLEKPAKTTKTYKTRSMKAE
jgi:hypothetical protein